MGNEFITKIRSNSINLQIVFAFVTLTALIIALEILAYSWIRQMVAINSLKESSSLLKEMQMQMKSASNEFILKERTNEQFFISGQSIFINQYEDYLNKLHKSINEMQSKADILNDVDKQEFSDLKNATNTYNEVFLEMVSKIKTRGYGRHGLIGEFDKSIKGLLQYDFGSDNMAVLNLQLFVKDYLLTGDQNLINNISNEVFNFTMVLESHVKDEEVEQVSDILINYETVFRQLTLVDTELGIYTGQGLQSRLYSAMNNLDKAVQLEKVNNTINEAYSNNLLKLYSSFFLVVGATLLAAFIINRRLYRNLVLPIHEMKSIISKMSQGEVPESKVVFKVDDLNEMATALNNLVAGIRNYRDFANNIGKGNLNTPFTPLSEKDILGSSLLTMRESLKNNAEEDNKRAWAAQGLAEMGALLRTQAKTQSELYNKILQFIVKYINCNQGGLFLLDEEDENYLELAACYAWEKRKYLDKRVHIGEGLIGQCMLEKEAVHLTNIPKDFIKITSGLGDSNPKALLVVPIKVEGQALGVLEIASFKKFEDHHIDLVKKFAENLASVINTERMNRKTKLLLQQAQQQINQLREQELLLKVE